MKTKFLRFAGVLTFACAALSTVAFAADKKPAGIAAIEEIDGIRPSADVFGAWSKPTQINSAEDAEKYFEGDALDKLKEKVDFENQIVLVFAWRGSGQDKLSYVVAESFPEQITFSMQPGRTRDLRPHIHIYALRNNVKWRVAAGRR